MGLRPRCDCLLPYTRKREVLGRWSCAGGFRLRQAELQTNARSGDRSRLAEEMGGLRDMLPKIFRVASIDDGLAALNASMTAGFSGLTRLDSEDVHKILVCLILI